MDASVAVKVADLDRAAAATPRHGGVLADLGAGTGAVARALADGAAATLRPDRVVAVDRSPTLLSHAAAHTRADRHDRVHLVGGDLTSPPLAPASLHAAVLCSVLHEVHSYQGYRRDAVDTAVAAAVAALRPGGVLLVRDGVAPDDPDRPVWLTGTAQTLATLARFARDFRGLDPDDQRGVAVEWRDVAGRSWARLRLHDAAEFLSKKDYHTNWAAEVCEEFGVWPLGGWADALTRAGLTVTHREAYANPWVVANRYDPACLLAADHGGDPGPTLPWPSTTCVLAGRRGPPPRPR